MVGTSQEDDIQQSGRDNNNNDEAAAAAAHKPLSETAFRRAEKHYKLYKPTKVNRRTVMPPETDFSEVLDFRNLSQNTETNAKNIKVMTLPPAHGVVVGGTMVQVCTFADLPGLVFLPNFLSIEQQQYWMRRSMIEFSCPPHPNNESVLQQQKKGGEGDGEANNNTNNKTDDVDDGDDYHHQHSLETQKGKSRGGYHPGLRWATLGYSYNWTLKSYHPDDKSPFPPELALLVRSIVADYFSKLSPEHARLAKNYEAQTSIVNYFPVGSQMCAHQDVSEAAMERPLVSISLGCSAVFLMGTTNRDDAPHAMWVRSGDVIIFSGPTRDAYHGVPRIMDDAPEYLLSAEKVGGLPGLRVNINVRQVFDENHGPEALPQQQQQQRVCPKEEKQEERGEGGAV